MVAALLWMLVHVWNAPPASLGEAAMREAVRRSHLPASTRVITNETLGPAPAVPGRPVTPPAAPASGVQPGGTETPGAKPEVKDEAWWRARITTARETLARDRLLRDAMQTRVSALANDIASRDDPEQRAQLTAARQLALAELDRLIKQIDADTKAITAVEDDARKAGVPPGWIR